MRFRITLQLTDAQKRLLPINYQYALSSWIYHVMYNGDSTFATWLHEEGYVYRKRPFKLFCFSQLQLPHGGFAITSDRILLKTHQISFEISFLLDEAIEPLVKGLFQEQQFSLGDKHSQVPFIVQHIQRMPSPILQTKQVFRALSPICVAQSIELDNGKRQTQYLRPDDDAYTTCLINNLSHKYKIAQQRAAPSTYGAIDDVPTIDLFDLDAEAPFALRILSRPRSKLITYKADTPQETKVRGYVFAFELTAPIELIRVAYWAGVGEKNSGGMGCLGVKNV